MHPVNQALRAHKLFHRDKDYIVRNGEVVIIDEFTGRMMPGRRTGRFMISPIILSLLVGILGLLGGAVLGLCFRDLRVLRGNPSRRPIYPEPQPAQPTDVPEPPPFLTGYAADEWWRTAPELHRLKLLTVLDVQVLAVYCIAYARWRTAEGALAHMAERDAQTSGLLIKSQGGDAMQNPLVGIARRAAADMVRFAGEFGMSPAARARISGLRRWIATVAIERFEQRRICPRELVRLVEILPPALERLLPIMARR